MASSAPPLQRGRWRLALTPI
uniref:Uncharacterized protein n=1 Tax=Arundo donax TaxID=35708 RepID=A0A0A8YA60_ARUDO